MKMDSSEFHGPESCHVDLGRGPTIAKPVYGSKKRYRKMQEDQVEQLSALQQLH